MANCSVPIGRKQRLMNAVAHSPGYLGQDMTSGSPHLSQLNLDSFTQACLEVKLIDMIHHRHAQRRVSKAILDSPKLTILTTPASCFELKLVPIDVSDNRDTQEKWLD